MRFLSEDGPGPASPLTLTPLPRRRAPFEVLNLTGNTWQWTGEYVDEYTRAPIVRGGGVRAVPAGIFRAIPSSRSTENACYFPLPLHQSKEQFYRGPALIGNLL